MNREEMSRFLEEYRDGVINEEDARKVASAIRDGGENAAWVLGELQFTGFLSQALNSMDDESFARSFIERLAAERSAKDFSRDVISAATGQHRAVGPQGELPFGLASNALESKEQREARAKRTKKWQYIAATVGLIGIVVVLDLIPSSVDDRMGTLSEITTGVSLIRHNREVLPHKKDKQIILTRGDFIMRGDVLRVPAADSARIRISEKSWINLYNGAAAVFAPNLPGETRVRAEDRENLILLLTEGILEALLEPRSQPVILATPHTIAESKEARFTVTVTRSTSVVSVESGRVVITRRSDGQSAILTAGKTTYVSAGGALLVE